MSAAHNARAAATLLASLVAGGVRHVVVSPGARNTPLMLAACARGDVRTHVVLDERAAAFFALGLARASGAPVMLACTSGSAGAHYLPAVIEADESQVPLVLCTADRPPELHGVGAPQTIEQGGLFGRFVRHAASLPAPGEGEPVERWRAAGAEAATVAAGLRPGPVHLNLPFRAPLWAPGVEPEPVEAAPLAAAVMPAPPHDAVRAAAALMTGRRGVIHVGPHAPDVGDALAGLARRLGWPVFAEVGSGVCPGALGVQHFDALLRDETFAQRTAPEVVLRLGRPAHSRAVGRWLTQAQPPVVLLAPTGRRFDLEGLVAAQVGGDAAQALGALVERVEPAPPAWLAAWQAADAGVDFEHTRLWGGALAARVGARPHDLHVASSLAYRDADAWVPRAPGRRVFCSRGVNGIDGTLATACGEAVATGRPLTLLLGDLTFLHDLGSLLVLAEQAPRLTVLVADNRGGGIFDHLPVAAHPTAYERCFVAEPAGDVAAFARAAGLPCRSVDDLAGLDAALAWADTQPGPAVIHARYDRQTDLAEHRRYWEAAR